ncbi:putative E3 ubiquitin-protein ligase LIN-1 [Rutidosis leptorrhynchoides]|uniref:putative E3 ubiquitin-protein ligase LIN-1 n=1 Tax=Rutidosis leptorrhynchoides TaxID=125765 RepID=UPI003A9960F9
MASISSSSPSSSSTRPESIHPDLLRLLVTSINRHINSIISDPKARKHLQTKCTSSLKIHKHSSLDISEQSILSNLRSGINNVEASINTKCSKLIKTSETLLQAPASLNENEVTAGLSNSYIICWSYFYLCMLKKVQGDELQVALHFLQALVVSPGLVRTELAPELYRTMVDSFVVPLRREFENGLEFDSVKWGATNYKAWLMYHQVISYGQSPLLMKQPDDTSQEIRYTKACSTSSPNSFENVRYHHQNCVSKKASESSSIKRLQELLLEEQSDSHSIYSGCNEFADDESEAYADEFDRQLRTLREVIDEQQPETEISMSKEPETQYDSTSISELEFWNCLDDEEGPTWQSYQTSQRRNEILFCGENSYRIEQAEIVEKVISKLCFSDKLGESEDSDDSTTVEITAVYEMLASKPGLKYSLLKDVILDQLLMALSTSMEESVTRASVSILSSIISSNRAVVEDIKKKGLNLADLANALKRDVYEAAVLIYLINPSPNEIKTLHIMPTLVKCICSSTCYNSGWKSLVVTPPLASLKIIEVLVTSFDYSLNDTHLAAICSPKVISSLVNIPEKGNLEEIILLAAILVKCMRFNGQCRHHISKFTPITPFVSLILSNQKHAILAGLEFYHELLRMPRPSSVNLLQQLREEGGINIMCVLLLAIQQTQQEYKLLASSLLLQLDILVESQDKVLNREEAFQTLLESLTCEENQDAQQLAAFLLSNLGGTYAWNGESYTIAWLLKKAGLNSMLQKNIVKHIDWSDDTLQESGTEIWSGKVARHILKLGDTVFYSLRKGLNSKNKRVSRDCLASISWIGCEIVKAPDDLRCSACDILLTAIEQYVHPGMELEERLLSCLCIYNYTFGRGMHKLTQLSEGVRESLRRLSSITWMAEELLKVADYYMPNKWRISCVHTQILEANYSGSGAVNSLIYYRGQLFSGYSNGSIKVWDIKGQTATLISDIKEHKKAVTCFTLYEPGNCLLSGSADKTIKIWQMCNIKMQCIEVITTKDTIQSLETCGEVIFAVTNNHKLKVFDSSRKVKDLFKNKQVKSIRASQGKLYIGCMDSSIQELIVGNNRQQEIKAQSNSWRIQNKPINSILLYKDWLYSASTCIDGSKIKDWRKLSKSQVCILPEKRANVVAMSIVEDFVYLNTNVSANNLEIWLRGTQQKVGRLSAGSKITSVLTANDMILCGTESGLIKGWIPL